MDKVRYFAQFLGALAICLGLAKAYEGDAHTAYLDAVNVPTICRGHTKDVHMGDTATEAECDQLTKEEMSEALWTARKYIKVDMPASRWAAVADLIYNVGETRFRTSTLLRKLNANDVIGACNEFPKWVYAKGRQLRGLVKRRAAERELCLRES